MTLSAILRAVRQIIGAPDYEGYLAHARRAHPDSEPMSEQDFVRCRLEARYDAPGSRCC